MTYERISELIDENAELKQRIADLEWELMLHTSGWARAPKEAMFRATDADGLRTWFERVPTPVLGPDEWFSAYGEEWCCDQVGLPADFTQTLEKRPAREAKS